ncbi:hypothetical protein I6E68_07435 [Salinibacterium sp. NSLL150]|nr:hypothetical protein [Salinibacterium sp. NSLL35]MBH0101723.1 hypothetical protein [Salinibacterium sp. NSLL150]MBH0104482.1 hypothetical protein [Salinibacterium sp. NSLL16]MBH0107243.1 hypothetical protein [Salinibacterium sp. NSLL17]
MDELDSSPRISCRPTCSPILICVSDAPVAAAAAQPVPESINDREFILTSSSGSAVSTTSPTRFRYHQDGQMVWGEYYGDTVALGRFVGRRDGDVVSIRFAHRLAASDDVVLGMASSTIRWNADGKLELFEEFEKNGEAQVSICVEADRRGAWPELDPAQRSSPQLDGTTFILEESTASTVSAEPTQFEFDENSGVVWGFYFGDTVTAGRCVGRYRDGVLDEFFVHHVIASDATLLGDSSTSLGSRADGRLELVEEFVLDGVPGKSVCVQVV